MPFHKDPSDQVALGEIGIVGLQLVVAQREQLAVAEGLQVSVAGLLEQKAGRGGDQLV